MSQELFTLEDCTIGTETDKAVCVYHEYGTHWIPLSHVEKMTRSKNKDCDTITMSAWIAKQKGFL